MGRCWTPSQRTPVQYNAGETRAAGERLGVAHSEVGTVCASCASTGLCGGQLATTVPTATLFAPAGQLLSATRILLSAAAVVVGVMPR
jgi:hypothetical protein